MTQQQFDELKSTLKSNEQFIALGFDACKDIMIQEILKEKAAQLRENFAYGKYADRIIESVLSSIQANDPIVPEGETEGQEKEGKVVNMAKKQEN